MSNNNRNKTRDELLDALKQHRETAAENDVLIGG